LNSLKDSLLFFIFVQDDWEETECSFESCIVVVLNMVSYFFHLQFVFCLASNQNNIRGAMSIPVLLHLPASSVVLSCCRTTSVSVNIILICAYYNFDFNLWIERYIIKRWISSKKISQKFVNIVISLLIIFFSSSFRFFGVKTNVVVKESLNLDLNILP
jgi:hypothetical protein